MIALKTNVLKRIFAIIICLSLLGTLFIAVTPMSVSATGQTGIYPVENFDSYANTSAMKADSWDYANSNVGDTSYSIDLSSEYAVSGNSIKMSYSGNSWLNYGCNKSVTVPADADGLEFWIKNTGASFPLTVQLSGYNKTVRINEGYAGMIRVPFSECISGGVPLRPVGGSLAIAVLGHLNFGVVYGSTPNAPIYLDDISFYNSNPYKLRILNLENAGNIWNMQNNDLRKAVGDSFATVTCNEMSRMRRGYDGAAVDATELQSILTNNALSWDNTVHTAFTGSEADAGLDMYSKPAVYDMKFLPGYTGSRKLDELYIYGGAIGPGLQNYKFEIFYSTVDAPAVFNRLAYTEKLVADGNYFKVGFNGFEGCAANVDTVRVMSYVTYFYVGDWYRYTNTTAAISEISINFDGVSNAGAVNVAVSNYPTKVNGSDVAITSVVPAAKMPKQNDTLNVAYLTGGVTVSTDDSTRWVNMNGGGDAADGLFGSYLTDGTIENWDNAVHVKQSNNPADNNTTPYTTPLNVDYKFNSNYAGSRVLGDITIFGGQMGAWSHMHVDIKYSTTTAPTTFTTLATVKRMFTECATNPVVIIKADGFENVTDVDTIRLSFHHQVYYDGAATWYDARAFGPRLTEIDINMAEPVQPDVNPNGADITVGTYADDGGSIPQADKSSNADDFELAAFLAQSSVTTSHGARIQASIPDGDPQPSTADLLSYMHDGTTGAYTKALYPKISPAGADLNDALYTTPVVLDFTFSTDYETWEDNRTLSDITIFGGNMGPFFYDFDYELQYSTNASPSTYTTFARVARKFDYNVAYRLRLDNFEVPVTDVKTIRVMIYYHNYYISDWNRFHAIATRMTEVDINFLQIPASEALVRSNPFDADVDVYTSDTVAGVDSSHQPLKNDTFARAVTLGTGAVQLFDDVFTTYSERPDATDFRGYFTDGTLSADDFYKATTAQDGIEQVAMDFVFGDNYVGSRDLSSLTLYLGGADQLHSSFNITLQYSTMTDKETFIEIAGLVERNEGVKVSVIDLSGFDTITDVYAIRVLSAATSQYVPEWYTDRVSNTRFMELDINMNEAGSETYFIGENEIFGVDDKTDVVNFLAEFTGADSMAVYDGASEYTEGYVGTGMILVVIIDTDEYEYTIIVKGDVDGDGIANGIDITEIKKEILGISPALGADGKLAADYDRDGDISVRDLIFIKQRIVNII